MSIPAARPKVRCLVIQLARLSDTLQSLMALRAAKQLYPELEIHFVVRDLFSEVPKRVPWLSKVHSLPTRTLLGPILDGSKTDVQSLGDLARWVSPLIDEPWDFVVNWSYSEASSHLAGLIPARVKLGFTRRPDGTFQSADGWSHFIQGVIQSGAPQNIHLTDILTTQLLTALQIHVGDPADEGDAPVTSKAFFSLELGVNELGLTWKDLSRKWIGVQIGSTREERTWDAQSWAQFITRVLNSHRDCNIAILGEEKDVKKATSIVRKIEAEHGDLYRNRILSLAGKTEFDLWASVISRCQWLISGDSSAVHLASVLGTRVLKLSFGGSRMLETGPYGNGHYVLASGLPCEGCLARSEGRPHTCRKDVSPEAVYTAWSYAQSEWLNRGSIALEEHFKQNGMAQKTHQVQVYRSKIRGTQEGGGVQYEPLFKRSIGINEWMAQVFGFIARAWYCGWTPPLGHELRRDMLSPALIQELRKLEESSSVLSKICDEARRASVQLYRYSSKLKSEKLMALEEKNQLVEMSKKLQDLNDLIERMGKAHAVLAPFARMSGVLLHNLKGEQISEISQDCADSYRQLGKGVSLLRDWISFTLDLARPRVLSTKLSIVESEPQA